MFVYQQGWIFWNIDCKDNNKTTTISSVTTHYFDIITMTGKYQPLNSLYSQGFSIVIFCVLEVSECKYLQWPQSYCHSLVITKTWWYIWEAIIRTTIATTLHNIKKYTFLMWMYLYISMFVVDILMVKPNLFNIKWFR